MKREYVRDWMTPDPVTVAPDTPVSQAYALMRRHHIRRLPVVESDWLVGIATLKDLWSAVASLEADADIFDAAFHMERFTVMQIMTQQVVTVAPDTPIEVACELMLKYKIGGLPVVADGRLVGILTESDIFQLVAQRWSETEAVVKELEGATTIGISTQVSLYPLGQESLSPVIDEALRIFREHGLEVEPGPMSSQLIGEDTVIFDALQETFRCAAELGPVVMVATFSNACPVPSEGKEEETATYRAIGHVENDFDGPTASGVLKSLESRIVLEPTLMEGLKGLEPGQKIMVVFHLHRSQGFDLLQHPRGDRNRPRRGVFSLRSPRRPNPIGITVVDLVAVEGNVLRVQGLDAINNTPVLDLKPA